MSSSSYQWRHRHLYRKSSIWLRFGIARHKLYLIRVEVLFWIENGQRGWTKSTWIWFHSDLSLVNPLSLRFGVAFHSSSFPSLYLNDKFTFWNGCAQTTVTEVVLISHDLHVLFSHGEYLNLQSRLALDALVLEGLLHYSGEWSSMGHRIVFFFSNWWWNHLVSGCVNVGLNHSEGQTEMEW